MAVTAMLYNICGNGRQKGDKILRKKKSNWGNFQVFAFAHFYFSKLLFAVIVCSLSNVTRLCVGLIFNGQLTIQVSDIARDIVCRVKKPFKLPWVGCSRCIPRIAPSRFEWQRSFLFYSP
jgi:hypothetical protein